MVRVRREGILLEPTDNEFENQAVLNPTIIQEGDTLHLLYRAVKEGNYSSIGYCKLKGPLNIIERKETPIIYPEHEYEKHGVEDPRIVLLDGVYYLFYTAYDGKNALIAYATSKDLINWEKHGTISPNITYHDARSYFKESKLKDKYFTYASYFKDEVAPDVLLWEKDAFICPRKYNNKFVLFHRIYPDIQIICFEDFSELTNDFWRNYLRNLADYVVLEPEFGFESRNIGAGAPLIETPRGWLMIYHSVQDSNRGKVYHASAALLDKKNPLKVIGRLHEPLFSPEEDYEISGDTNDVVFPTGTAKFNGQLYIYYGAADKRIAVVSVNMNKLLHELLASEVEAGIGFLAGKVFTYAINGEKTLTQIKDRMNQEESAILMAIGWLARENKILIRFDDGELVVRTID